MLTKITSDSEKNWISLSRALVDTLNEKDIMFYFNSPAVNKVVADSGWDGGLGSKPNSFMFVDANLGLNKANFFIRRDVGVSTVIDKTGSVVNSVTVHYKNSSIDDSWPGGNYKNYVRFLVPVGSVVEGINIGDARNAVISPTLTEVELKKINPMEQFFVYQSGEVSNFNSYGTLINIPAKSELTIIFKYRLPYKMAFTPTTSFVFNYLKQPGSGTDPLDVSVEYPVFLAPENSNSLGNLLPLAFPHQLIYNSDTSVDRKFEIKFINKA
ncbi:hypothetical protein HY310_00970, partial [Candidatus Microgenomates bacterium]|nr:hypothetical protein [Candidatus Microgenomates bacterium]